MGDPIYRRYSRSARMSLLMIPFGCTILPMQVFQNNELIPLLLPLFPKILIT